MAPSGWLEGKFYLSGAWRNFNFVFKTNLGKKPVGQEMASWVHVEGFEFQHDLITPSLDRQTACLSLLSGAGGEVRLT